MRLRVSYFDQNEQFAPCLPRDGTVVRRVAIAELGSDWHLVELDTPFSYMNREHGQLLVRSRWAGQAVGEAEATSVFILLIPNPAALEEALPAAAEFDHVAWGMSATLPEAPPDTS